MSLLVSPNGGLANVVIYVRPQKEISLAVHPDYKKMESANVYMDIKGCTFKPHMLVMRTSQTLVLSNSDLVLHDPRVDLIKTNPFQSHIPANKSVEKKFEKVSPIPGKVNCACCPWMRGYIVLRDDPYATVSGKDGRFTIKNLPVGTELEFQIWHEKPGYIKTVSIGGKKIEWYRGRFNMTINPGDNDLGEIKLSPELFK